MGNRWDRRDRKRKKARHGMRVTGRSIISIQKALAERRRKEMEEEMAAEADRPSAAPPSGIVAAVTPGRLSPLPIFSAGQGRPIGL